MIKTEEVVEHEFTSVRTGKASPSLVENILVICWRIAVRVRELAHYRTLEPRGSKGQPWDAGTAGAIESDQKANLGLNPAVRANCPISLPGPGAPNVAEFVKLIHKMAERPRGRPPRPPRRH